MVELQLTPVIANDPRFVLFAEATKRLNRFDLSPILVYLIDSVDESALYYLAEQFSLLGYDGWTLAESDEQKRDLIKTAIALHRRKGTPWSIREIFRRLGFGEIDIVEGVGDIYYDGQWKYNGYKLHGGDETSWAVYRVVLKEQPVTNDQADLLRKTLTAFAPARCHLQSLDYQSVPLRYNGVGNFDGQYNFGSA